MAAHDMTYTNSASTSIDLHAATYRWRQIRGITQPSYTPIIREISASTPPGVYVTSNGVIRRIEIDIKVMGATPSAVTTNLRTLQAALAVDMRDGRLGTLAYTAANAVSRSIKVTPVPADVEQWVVSGAANPATALMTLLFDAPGATFYDPVAKQATGTFNGTTNVNVSCASSGDVDAYPTITWEDVVTAGKVTDAYGHWFKMTSDVALGETLIINMDPQELSIELDAVDKYDYQDSASRLVVVKYGTNNLVFVGADAGDDGGITVDWYDRYSSHG
jgi:hypothetical protein